MGNKTLTGVGLVINNKSIEYLPNSLKHVQGKGETTIRTVTTGGGNLSTYFAENIETKIAKVMFEIIPTSDNIEDIRAWKENQNNNAIRLIHNDGFVATISNAVLINDPEISFSYDGIISLEFHGDQAV